MSFSESDLEKSLRTAPRPQPPADLEQQLMAEIPRSARWRFPHFEPAGWVRRWWPALAPAALSVACAAIITAQQMEIHELKQTSQAAAQSVSPGDATAQAAPDANLTNSSLQNAADAEQAEIQRLRELLVQLSQEITHLQQMKAENARLRSQLAAPSIADLSPEEREAMQKAKEKADAIRCVNNLKQIGLALRVWALDNENHYPPNFLVMSNELSTPKVLVCPSDTAHPAASAFPTFGPANCSYEYLAPMGDEKPEETPQRIMVRCPIHGNIGLADGSVMMRVAKDHPEQIIQRDGKLFFESHPQPAPNP